MPLSFRAVLATTMFLLMAGGTAASAQQAKCLASKSKCVAKKVGALLECHQIAETPGKPADPNAKGCLDQANAAFDGGSTPTKGCFEKLENKVPNDCLLFDDTAAAGGVADTCVAQVVAAIDPGPIDQTKCGAGKKKCVAAFVQSLLKCHQAAATPGKPADPNTKGCLDAARAKFTGGVDPAKGCFEKLESKAGNDCQIQDDAAALQALAEGCVTDVNHVLTTPRVTLQNPDFDLGHVGWGEESPIFPGALIFEQGVGGAPAAHSGTHLAWLGGANNETSDLVQIVAVPAGIEPSFVHFRYQIASDETNCSQVTPSDAVALLINGVQVDSLVLCSAFNTGANWTEFSFVQDLAAYAGKTIALRIRVRTDGALSSSFYLDSLRISSTP